MNQNPARVFAPLALASLATALCGCPNPNSYGTPRTVAPGEFAHTVAIEGFGYTGEVQSTEVNSSGETVTTTETVGGFLPTLPSYALRIGATDFMDVGLHLHNLTSLGFDLKLNPVRGFFDLAVDPGMQYFFFTANDATVHVIYIHGPLMLGLNPTDWFSVVLVPGITYGAIVGDIVSDGDEGARTADGVIFRGGLGLDFRVSDGFAIHPEFTLMKSLEGPGLVYNVGVGFNFGTLPSFADISGG